MSRSDLGFVVSRALAVYVGLFVLSTVLRLIHTLQLERQAGIGISNQWPQFTFLGALIGLGITLWLYADRFAGPPSQKGAPLSREGLCQALFSAIGLYLLAQSVVEITSRAIEVGLQSALRMDASQTSSYWVLPTIQGIVGLALFIWYRGHTVTTSLSDQA